METKLHSQCLYCNSPLSEARIRRHAKYCGQECSRADLATKYKSLNTPIETSTGNVGAIGELLVSVDLLKRNMEVFRSVSPSTSCDLAVLCNGKLKRVEVTKAFYTPNGKVQFTKHKSEKYDVLALYFSDFTVEYRPPIEEW